MKRVLLVVSLAVGATASTTGCGLLDPEAAFFTVAVDSVTGPDSVTAGSAHVQRLWGPLSSNGCASVDRLFVRAGAVQTEIQVQGRRVLGSCEAEPSKYMNGREVTLTAPTEAGTHTLRILRPGVPLIRTIVVK